MCLQRMLRYEKSGQVQKLPVVTYLAASAGLRWARPRARLRRPRSVSGLAALKAVKSLDLQMAGSSGSSRAVRCSHRPGTFVLSG